MIGNLTGKTAIVTGAAQGLGYAIAKAYALAGMRVALMDVRKDALAAVQSELGDNTAPFVVDLSDGEIAKKIESIFDMRPAYIVRRLKLKNPIYSESAAYGHMGRVSETKTVTFNSPGGKTVTKEVETFTWEKLDYVDAVKREFGL